MFKVHIVVREMLKKVNVIGHFQKYHNTLCLSLQNFISIAFIFSWDCINSQEKMETMFRVRVRWLGG